MPKYNLSPVSTTYKLDDDTPILERKRKRNVELKVISRRVNANNNLHTRYPSIQVPNVGIINPNAYT